jgi:uncharacterized membrane protein (DUF2068 family)
VRKTKKRPLALVVIIIYKAFTALLLAVTSIAIFLAVKNYQDVLSFADNYILKGKIEIIKWLLYKTLNLNPRTLQFSGIATGSYAVVTAIEAVGLWYEKAWATLLVVVLVGISLPAEIFELIKGVSLIKVVVFLINAALFWYLLRKFPKRKSLSASR